MVDAKEETEGIEHTENVYLENSNSNHVHMEPFQISEKEWQNYRRAFMEKYDHLSVDSIKLYLRKKNERTTGIVDKDELLKMMALRSYMDTHGIEKAKYEQTNTHKQTLSTTSVERVAFAASPSVSKEANPVPTNPKRPASTNAKQKVSSLEMKRKGSKAKVEIEVENSGTVGIAV